MRALEVVDADRSVVFRQQDIRHQHVRFYDEVRGALPRRLPDVFPCPIASSIPHGKRGLDDTLRTLPHGAPVIRIKMRGERLQRPAELFSKRLSDCMQDHSD